MLLLPLLSSQWSCGSEACAGKRKQKEEPAEQAAPTPAALPPAPALFPGALPLETPALPEGLAGIGAQTCNACHFSLHDRWGGSAHALAWQSGTLQAAVESSSAPQACLSCHLPLQAQHPLLEEGAAEGEGERRLVPNPHWAPSLQLEGVGCAACHLREGTVLGVHASENAPHPVVVSEELQSSEMCGTCHQLTWPDAQEPLYDTYGEWSRSAYAEAGVGCQDCHMPQRAGSIVTGAYGAQADHYSPRQASRALTLTVEDLQPILTRGEESSASLRVQNTGAGHSFPTGSPFTFATIQAELLDAAGKTLGTPIRHRLAREIEQTPPYAILEDTRLPAQGEILLPLRWDVPYEALEGEGLLQVQVFLESKMSEESSGRQLLQEQKIPLRLE